MFFPQICTIQYCLFIETTATNLLVFLCGTDLYLDYNVAKLSDFNKIYLKKKKKKHFYLFETQTF